MPSYGVCLEGFRDDGKGPMAWTIVQQGTLKVGDTVLCGPSFGRVRAMYDGNGKAVKKAGPSTPVKVAGLDEVPGAGDRFFETDNVEDAREAAEERRTEGRDKLLARRGGGAKTMEQILAGSGPKELPVIIKADTPGSVEAIVHELEKFEHDEVAIRFLHEAVGGRQRVGRVSRGQLGGDDPRLPGDPRRPRQQPSGQGKGRDQAVLDHLRDRRRHSQHARRHAGARKAGGRHRAGDRVADVLDQPVWHDRRLPRAFGHDPAERPRSRHPRPTDPQRTTASPA